MYDIKTAAEKLGVTTKTLQRWDKEGKLVAQRTPTNRRIYTDMQINNILYGESKTIYVTIKERYVKMHRMDYLNVSGHIVPLYCEALNINVNAEYDKTEINGINVMICTVNDMVIISSPTEKDILERYMEENNIKKGIIICGMKWIMRDGENEYCFEFLKDDAVKFNVFIN